MSKEKKGSKRTKHPTIRCHCNRNFINIDTLFMHFKAKHIPKTLIEISLQRIMSHKNKTGIKKHNVPNTFTHNPDPTSVPVSWVSGTTSTLPQHQEAGHIFADDANICPVAGINPLTISSSNKDSRFIEGSTIDFQGPVSNSVGGQIQSDESMNNKYLIENLHNLKEVIDLGNSGSIAAKNSKKSVVKNFLNVFSRRIKCHLCTRRFHSNDDLSMHIKAKHITKKDIKKSLQRLNSLMSKTILKQHYTPNSLRQNPDPIGASVSWVPGATSTVPQHPEEGQILKDCANLCPVTGIKTETLTSSNKESPAIDLQGPVLNSDLGPIQPMTTKYSSKSFHVPMVEVIELENSENNKNRRAKNVCKSIKCHLCTRRFHLNNDLSMHIKAKHIPKTVINKSLKCLKSVINKTVIKQHHAVNSLIHNPDTIGAPVSWVPGSTSMVPQHPEEGQILKDGVNICPVTGIELETLESSHKESQFNEGPPIDFQRPVLNSVREQMQYMTTQYSIESFHVPVEEVIELGNSEPIAGNNKNKTGIKVRDTRAMRYEHNDSGSYIKGLENHMLAEHNRSTDMNIVNKQSNASIQGAEDIDVKQIPLEVDGNCKREIDENISNDRSSNMKGILIEADNLGNCNGNLKTSYHKLCKGETESMFGCNFCNRYFEDDYDLFKHMEYNHIPHRCWWCGYISASKYWLLRHLAFVHNIHKRPYQRSKIPSKTKVKPASLNVKVKPASLNVKVKPASLNVKVEPASVNVKVEPASLNVKVEPASSDVKVEPPYLDIKIEPVFIKMEPL